MYIDPPVNRSIPAWHRRSVVLPDPDGPSSTRKVPGSMWRSTPERAGLAPNDLVTPARSTLSPRLGSSPLGTGSSAKGPPPPNPLPAPGGEKTEAARNEGDHNEHEQQG